MSLYYDFQTDNESFIQISKVFKDLGIKNWMFPLRLYDKDLMGLHVYLPNGKVNPDLTMTQKLKILREVRINIWYFIREIVMIPESGGKIRFQAHRANMAQAFCVEHNIDIIELLPRQNGKTIGAVCLLLWVYLYATVNTKMVFSNKKFEDSKLNLQRLKDIKDELPDFLKQMEDVSLDTDNLETIATDSTGNSINTIPAPTNAVTADKLGRGLTIPIIWFDEFAFLAFNKKVFDSAAFALSKASESAERNNTPHIRMITTTPNDLDSNEGSYCYSLIDAACKFDEAWYDMDINLVKAFIRENSKNDFVHIQFSYKELGRDEAWLEKQKKLVNNDLLTIKREIFIEWTLAGDESPFSEEQLNTLEGFVKPPISSFTIDNVYKFYQLEEMPRMISRTYIIAIDIAGGLDSDSSVITVIDPLTYKPCLIFRNNKIDTVQLANLIEKLVSTYFPKSVVVPERNNMGISVIHMLLRSSIASNLYYEVKEKLAEKDVQLRGKAPKKKKVTRVYGINTSTKSRDIMFKEILNMVVNEHPERVNNEFLFNEIKALVRDKKDKIQARIGLHDDVVMSYLIGMYMALYGVRANQVLTNIYTYGKDDPENESYTNSVHNVKKGMNFLHNMNNMTKADVESFNRTMDFANQISNNAMNDDDMSNIKKRKLKRGLNFLKEMNR